MKQEWIICEKTQMGISHLKKGKGCEDQLCVKCTEDMLIAVLADGAGSRSHAAEGARIVVETLAECLEQKFDLWVQLKETEASEKILEVLLEVLEQKSREIGIELKEFASTLIFAAVKEDRYLFGNLGDGVIGYQKTSDHWVICGPDHGRMPGETVFVTSKWKNDRLHVRIGTGTVSRIVMMTDGVAELWYEEQTGNMSENLERTICSMEQETLITELWKEAVLEELQKDVWDDIGFILASRRKI